ncbi:MAG: NUDIX domain-containing protein [Candidatus Saccharimonadales bacterium]
MSEEFEKRTSGITRGVGVLLVSTEGKLIGHLRDNTPGIDCPGMIGTFGGGIEEGELPIEAAVRELREETNLGFKAEELRPFMCYKVHQELSGRDHVLCFFIAEKGVDTDSLEVYEGAGHYIIESPDDPLICAPALPVFRRWFDSV